MSQTERKRKATVPAAGPAGGGGGGAPKVTRGGKELKVKNPEEVLKRVKELSIQLRKATENTPERTLANLDLGFSAREVVDKDNSAVLDEIEASILSISATILEGNGFAFDVPSRAKGNQMYVPELDRIVLQDSVSKRSFAATQTCRKTAITTRILGLVHQLCVKQIHVTKRDLFYTDVKLFEDQGQSDTILDDLACMLGCTRSSLNVVASEKGVVVGRLQFEEDGDAIDCCRMGIGGKAIPPNVDKVAKLQSDALFILLVEKDAAFMRLAEDRFYNTYPCIILTAKGQPDVATRLFLRKLKTELNIPVLGLVDSDPYGLKILSVYMKGSMNMSYDSSNLTTPDIKWLGIRPSDLDRFSIPQQCRLPMTEEDIKTGKKLLEEDFVKANPKWVIELELMLKTREKAEIQALSSFGFQYLSQVYLPLKLQEGDWI
uniref:DNA topoisomerase 6 subunit A n=1 Tax=Chlamydomonas euryale TaxID=1486919 RepID=A0A7R9VR90_9CHLO|mmetsp:Transcript_4162/g.11942  ORF Transcript_4162/g.11942 Transcript_4162/m.11942 type:complete len:433 (+) Transcript_4162:169-1467(+)